LAPTTPTPCARARSCRACARRPLHSGIAIAGLRSMLRVTRVGWRGGQGKAAAAAQRRARGGSSGFKLCRPILRPKGFGRSTVAVREHSHSSA
jgi:hypothetical protein